MFSYRIVYFNGEENSECEETGLMSAENYFDATSKLVDYYGDVIISVTIEREGDIVPTHEMREIFINRK